MTEIKRTFHNLILGVDIDALWDAIDELPDKDDFIVRLKANAHKYYDEKGVMKKDPKDMTPEEAQELHDVSVFIRTRMRTVLHLKYLKQRKDIHKEAIRERKARRKENVSGE